MIKGVGFFLQILNTCGVLTISLFSFPESWLWGCQTLLAHDLSQSMKYTLQFSDTELHITMEWHEHSTSIIFYRFQTGTSPHHSMLVIHQQNKLALPLLWDTRNKHCKNSRWCRHCCVSVQGKPTRKYSLCTEYSLSQEPKVRCFLYLFMLLVLFNEGRDQWGKCSSHENQFSW